MKKNIYLSVFFLFVLGVACNNNSQSDKIELITFNDTSLQSGPKQIPSYPANKICYFDSIKVDTIINNYKISFLVQDNKDIITRIRAVGDTSYYACNDVILDIQPHDYRPIHVKISRLMFTSFVPENELCKYHISSFHIKSVNTEGISFTTNLCMPDTDICYFFELFVSNEGDIRITDITPDEDEL